MDWPKFEFCVILWVICVSKTSGDTTLTSSNTSTEKCKWGEVLPRKDECNVCICYEGEVQCTNLPCNINQRIDGQPECEDGQPWIHLDECNSCFCEEGKLECSDYICIRGSKCKKGDRIPKPDRCNACECVNGHVGCTNIECRPLRKPLSSDNATTEPFGETTTNRGATLDYAATTVKGVVLDDNMLIAKRIEIVLKPTVGVETTTEQGALSNDWVILEKRVKVDEFPDKETVTDKGFTTDKGLTTDEGFTTDVGVTTDKVTAINEGDAINGDKDAIMIPEVDKRFGIDEEATKVGESFKQCENGVDIPPPPPPLDCNVCICLNNQILCTVDACKDGVPDVKSKYNIENDPNENLGQYDKKISVDPYLDLIYKKYDKTPTKLVHTHAYNGFHQEIKVHSRNLSQDTSKLIKALASSLDNPMLNNIGEKIKSSSPSDFEEHTLKYSSYNPYEIETTMGKHPNLSENNPLHSLSSLITSGTQSNDTILVIPSKDKTFISHVPSRVTSPYTINTVYEQQKPYYSTTLPSNILPKKHLGAFENRLNSSPSKGSDTPALDTQSIVTVIPGAINNKQNGSPNITYNLIQSQHPDDNNYSNITYEISLHPNSKIDAQSLLAIISEGNKNKPNEGLPNNTYFLNQLQHLQHPDDKNHANTTYNIKVVSFHPSGNNGQYQPIPQLGSDATVYRPNPHQPNLYPTSDNHFNPNSPSNSQSDQNYSNPSHNQSILPDKDRYYPHPSIKINKIIKHYKTDSPNNVFDSDKGKPIPGTDHRGSSYGPLYTKIDPNPAIHNTHPPPQNGLPETELSKHKLLFKMPVYDPSLIGLPEKEVLSPHDKNISHLPHSPFEPNTALYKKKPVAELANRFIHKQGKPLSALPPTQEHDSPQKHTNVVDDVRPHNLVYHIKYEPNPMIHHDQPPQKQFLPSNKRPHPFEPNETHSNLNVYQINDPNSVEIIHIPGQGEHPQLYNTHLQENSHPPSIVPNQEDRFSALDNNGNHYNLNDSHYKTVSSVTYVTQYGSPKPGLVAGKERVSPNSSLYHHPNSIELNGRGTNPDGVDHTTQNNSYQPEHLSIQRENKVDPTIVKVYQYLNQPRINYSPNHNEDHLHITSHTSNENYHLLPESENLHYPARFSGSVEDINSSANSEYPNPLHMLSSLGFHNKDPNSHPIRYDDSQLKMPALGSKSLYTMTKYDENMVPIKNAKIMTPEELFGSTRSPLLNNAQSTSNDPNRYDDSQSKVPTGGSKSLYTMTKYDENMVPIKNAKIVTPEELFGSTRSPLLNNAQSDKNKVSTFNDPHASFSSQPNLSQYNLEKLPFAVGKYDKNKVTVLKYPHKIISEVPEYSFENLPFKVVQYDKNVVPVHKDPYNSSLQPKSSEYSFEKLPFKVMQYDKNMVPVIKVPHNSISQPKSEYNIEKLPFAVGQYDKNKIPVHKNPYNSFSQPEASEHKLQSPFTLEYDPNKTYEKNNPNSQPKFNPYKLENLPFKTGQYDKTKFPAYKSPYDGISHPDTSEIHESYEKKKLPSYYDPKKHPDTSEIHESYEKKIVPSYNEIPKKRPLKNEQIDINKALVNYDPYARNISQAGASNEYQKNSPRDKNKGPTAYSPYDPHNSRPKVSSYESQQQNPSNPFYPNFGKKKENSKPAHEHSNTYDSKYPKTLSDNPHATLTSVHHENSESPIKKRPNSYSDNHSHPHYENDGPFNHGQQDPSQHKTQPGKGRYDGRGSGKRPHYRPDSREDSDPINKKKTYHSEPNFQHDVKFDERGSLDPFQYKEPSEKEYTVKKVKLNKHKPPKTIPDEDQYLSVIPHKSDYPSYSLYPKKNNDPRSQPKYTENLPTSVSQDSITNPGSQEESQNPKTYQNYVNEPPLKPETDTFDDRGAHEGFQYISNSDENSSDPVNSKNKPDHNQLDPSNRGKKSKPTSDTVDMQSIDPAVLKILENAHKPLSIEDLLNELDGHKHPHNDPTNHNNDNDELQSRFNDDGPDVPSYPTEQMNKKAPTSPPIDDSGFSLSDLDPFVLLRLLFPSGFDPKKTDKNNDQQKGNEKDLLAVLLGSQNIYTNTTKYNKPLNKENYNYTIVKYNITPLSSSKNPRDEKKIESERPGQNPTVNHLDSRNDMSKANAFASQPKLNGLENDQKPKVFAEPEPNLNQQHHPGNNLEPKIEVQNHHNVYTVPFQAGTIPSSTSGQGQDQPQYQQYAIISDEGKKLPPIQYPEVHIILHQRKDDDNDDVISYFPSLLNSRMKNLKEPKSECGENSHWTRNCHACVCRGGQASCVKVPDCVQRALDEPMMCKPYSTFKMGTCYSCECNGDGIPECDAAGCKIEPKIHETEEESGEIKHTVYHEFYDEGKTKDMLSYYKFFKKLPKESFDEYPTCEPGTLWTSSCHNCECNDNYKHECTLIEECVLDLEALGKPGKCKPNSKFYPKSTNVACQQCSCDDEANPFCPLEESQNVSI